MLLERGAEPNLQTTDGWTALMFSCADSDRDGNMSIVQSMLDASADINLQNKEGATALSLVLKGNRPL